MTTPKRPRCRRCGSTTTQLLDGVCFLDWECGVRVGAKGERERIKRGVKALAFGPGGRAGLVDRMDVLAVVARKVGR
jgi:hypothetical protein